MKRILNTILLVIFLLLLFAATFTSSNDFSQDLGRHLKLGEIIVHTKTIPSINLFSYTYPHYRFINHHWLSEVLFYLSYSFNPSFLIIMKTFLVMFSFFIVIRAFKSNISMFPAILSAFLFFPLFLDRNDIRPELFGYAFYAVCLFIFNRSEKLSVRNFIIFSLIFSLWVNMHISFVFGLFVFGLFMVKQFNYVTRGGIFRNKWILFTFAVLFLCLNPNGIQGALYPFQIFGNYGYPIVENQNLFFLSERIINPLISYFFIISPIVFITAVVLIIQKKITECILVLTMFVASCIQIRHFPFFVLTIIPYTASSVYVIGKALVKKIHPEYKQNFYMFATIALCFCIGFASLFFFDNTYYLTFDSTKRFGFEFEENEKEATDFILNNKLETNIFNTFDVGGYLAYRLYPYYRLFIDNRPEAYPKDFVQNTYIRLQENEAIQDKVFEKYMIKTIVVNHTDDTPWAVEFLSRIQKDKRWKLIFLNNRIIIFSRKQLRDIREERYYLYTKVEEEQKYINLINYYKIFRILEQKELAEKVFQKARRLAGYSCSMKRSIVQQMENSVYFSETEHIKQSAFWCF